MTDDHGRLIGQRLADHTVDGLPDPIALHIEVDVAEERLQGSEADRPPAFW